MMKKTYIAPEADLISFMARENIAVVPGSDPDKFLSPQSNDNTQTPDASETWGGGVDEGMD